jgi:hypothetical protein
MDHSCGGSHEETKGAKSVSDRSLYSSFLILTLYGGRPSQHADATWPMRHERLLLLFLLKVRLITLDVSKYNLSGNRGKRVSETANEITEWRAGGRLQAPQGGY